MKIKTKILLACFLGSIFLSHANAGPEKETRYLAFQIFTYGPNPIISTMGEGKNPQPARFDYAERIRERLPRKLQELRETAGMSKYALWQKCGVSRDMIGRIEGGESIPTLHVSARLACGVEMTLQEFVGTMEDDL